MDNPVPTGRRTALVTGASFGIGAAIALDLAQHGFDVAVSATRVENLTSTLAAIAATGARAVPLAFDLRSIDAVVGAVDTAIETLGRLDVLVNNAGVPLHKAALEITPDEWEAVWQTNVSGTFFACQRFARHVVARGGSGAIVNLSSTHGLVGFSGVAAYGISKAALIHLSKTLAVEWAEAGIRVNAVVPGTVFTASRAATLADPERQRNILGRVPMHRYGTPEEMAAAVRYLVSPEAGYITGQTIVLDGGLTACGARGAGPK